MLYLPLRPIRTGSDASERSERRERHDRRVRGGADSEGAVVQVLHLYVLVLFELRPAARRHREARRRLGPRV